MATVLPFIPGQHTSLIPYLAAIHASCITHDRTVATFLPPLSHEKLLSWWKDRIAEITAGSRLLFVLVRDDDNSNNNSNENGGSSTTASTTTTISSSSSSSIPRGPNVVGVVMLGMPPSETGALRGVVEKLLVHPSHRGRGGARVLMGALEKEALKRGRTVLTLDTETGSPAETVYNRLGYTEMGKIPKYSISPSGEIKDETFFYKLLDG